MCLRSGLDTETAWALNALNVQLSDDSSGGLPKGTDLQPLLHALTEHLWALLSVLWPSKFKVGDFESTVQVVGGANYVQNVYNDVHTVGLVQLKVYVEIVKMTMFRGLRIVGSALID